MTSFPDGDLPAPELVAHCDVTPRDVVFRAGRPVALIDFDLARPTSRLLDVLSTARWWVPIAPPEDRPWPGVDLRARLTLFLDAYGGGVDRDALLDLADPVWRRSWYSMRHNARTLGGGRARMWDEGVGDVIERRREWFAAARAGLASLA